MCYTYHSLFEMNIACLRYFTVYGPGQRPDALQSISLQDLCWKMRKYQCLEMVQHQGIIHI
ncbi:MAG: hypothetical protein ACLSBH_11090 [Coprobacillus cateniformis]